MKTDNVLLVVAVIAVIVSIVGAGITYSYLAAFRNTVTGLATSGGWVNLSVESKIAINFTFNSINWSNGSVNDGKNYAVLDTSNQSSPNVTDGSWKGNNAGLVIQNIGNRNVTLKLKASSNDTAFVGGTAGGGPQYKWKVKSNYTSSCRFNDTTYYNNKWTNVNTSDQLFCDYFDYVDGVDEVRIDFWVRIPSDSLTGDRGNTITATFDQAT